MSKKPIWGKPSVKILSMDGSIKLEGELVSESANHAEINIQCEIVPQKKLDESRKVIELAFGVNNERRHNHQGS